MSKGHLFGIAGLESRCPRAQVAEEYLLSRLRLYCKGSRGLRIQRDWTVSSRGCRGVRSTVGSKSETADKNLTRNFGKKAETNRQQRLQLIQDAATRRGC